MPGDEYLVRLTPAPRAPGLGHGPAPQAPAARRVRRRSRKLIIAAVVLLLVLFNRDTVEGWVMKALDQAKVPVRALEADGELRKATEAMERTWTEHGTYNVGLAVLEAEEPQVAWREVVRYQVCFGGAGAVVSADAATGTRSILHLRGVDFGSAEGEPGCPVSEGNLRPWSRQ